MYEYNNKLTQAQIKINNTPDLRINAEDEKRVMQDMISFLMNNECRKRARSELIETDKENDLNFDNVHIDLSSSKTMKNSKK